MKHAIEALRGSENRLVLERDHLSQGLEAVDKSAANVRADLETVDAKLVDVRAAIALLDQTEGR